MHEARQEDPAMQSLRDALGAVAAGPALAYSLTRSSGARWRLRCLDRNDGEEFESRDAAFTAMRRAVVRCSAYALLVEGCTGDIDIQFLDWNDQSAQRFGIRP